MLQAGGEPNDERLKSFTTLIWQAPVLEIMVPFQQQIDTSTKLRILREIPWQVSDYAQKMNRVNFDHLLLAKNKDMQNAKHGKYQCLWIVDGEISARAVQWPHGR